MNELWPWIEKVANLGLATVFVLLGRFFLDHRKVNNTKKKDDKDGKRSDIETILNGYKNQLGLFSQRIEHLEGLVLSLEERDQESRIENQEMRIENQELRKQINLLLNGD